jgi:hypothetical protein
MRCAACCERATVVVEPEDGQIYAVAANGHDAIRDHARQQAESALALAAR